MPGTVVNFEAERGPFLINLQMCQQPKVKLLEATSNRPSDKDKCNGMFTSIRD